MQSAARESRWASFSFRRVRTPRAECVRARFTSTNASTSGRKRGGEEGRRRRARGRKAGCLESKFLSSHVNRYVDGPIEGLSTYFCIPFLRRADPVRLEWKSIQHAVTVSTANGIKRSIRRPGKLFPSGGYNFTRAYLVKLDSEALILVTDSILFHFFFLFFQFQPFQCRKRQSRSEIRRVSLM